MHSANAILARTQFDSSPKIVNSHLKDVYIDRTKQQTLHQMLLEKLESQRYMGQKIFDEQTLQSFTYQELATLIRKVATAFADLFLVPGDYVLYLGTNCIEYLSLYFGAICIGAIPISVPYTDDVTLQDIKTKIIQHNIQYLVFSEEVDPVWIQKLLNSLSMISKVIVYNNNDLETYFNKKILVPSPSSPLSASADHHHHHPLHKQRIVNYFEFIQNSNIASISDDDLYRPKNLPITPCFTANSSGSSQWPPKTWVYSHYSVVGAIDILVQPSILDYRSIDRLLVYGAFETMENILMFLIGIFFGCHIILLPRYKFDSLVEAITVHRINLAWLSSHTIHKLLKMDLSAEYLNNNPKNRTTTTNKDYKPLQNLIKIITFGGRVPATNCREFFHKFTSVKSLRHCYVIAESPLPVSMMIQNSHNYDSVGYLLPNTKVKVITEPANWSPTEANRVGIVCLEREPELFALGYFVSNSHQLYPLQFEPIEEQIGTPTVITAADVAAKGYNVNADHSRRWLQTDDIGYFSDEGLLYLHGKYIPSLSSVASIRSRIQENEIESTLLTHPSVVELALVLKRDKTWAAVVVVQNYARIQLSQLTVEIATFLKDKLNNSSTQPKVSNIFIKHSLTKTASGRIVRCLIREEVQNLLNIKRKF